MLENDVLISGVAHLERAPEEGSQTPKLILAPGLVRVIVTLRAIEPAAKKNPDFLSHRFTRRANNVVRQKMARRAVVALGREPLASNLVVRLIAGDVVPHPVGIHLAPLRPDAIREDGHPENIVEAESPVI